MPARQAAELPGPPPVVSVGVPPVGSVRHISARSCDGSGRAPLTDGPLLGYKQARGWRRQFKDISDFVSAEVDAVDALRQFAREEHTHTYGT